MRAAGSCRSSGRLRSRPSASAECSGQHHSRRRFLVSRISCVPPPFRLSLPSWGHSFGARGGVPPDDLLWRLLLLLSKTHTGLNAGIAQPRFEFECAADTPKVSVLTAKGR